MAARRRKTEGLRDKRELVAWKLSTQRRLTSDIGARIAPKGRSILREPTYRLEYKGFKV